VSVRSFIPHRAHATIGVLGAVSVATACLIEGSPAAEDLKARIERIRLAAGPLMNLGDVSKKSVPKMMLVAPPRSGGAVSVRSFIPHRAHASIGVLGAVSVATACLVPGSPAAEVAQIPEGRRKTLSVEHPSGEMSCVLEVDERGEVVSSALLRTARKLMDGIVFA
jgi:4-oxalomesaconate tautomerase